jgi:N-acyl homoserine lactone hydrolase
MPTLAAAEKLRGIQERTGAMMVFVHDADQIHQLRVAPKGWYS